MILGAPVRLGLDPLAWEIIPFIELGPIRLSPHGVGIAIGFLIGAQYMARRARAAGGPDESHVWNIVFWCLVGAIIGARVAYVIGHLSEVTNSGADPLGVVRVWEGGISLLGGITGGVLASVPYIRRHGLGFWRMADLAAPGLALGIAVGRIGDLVIGDHIGKPTGFWLGWRCLGEVGGIDPRPAAEYRQMAEAGSPPALGCYDLPLHQTALYDFVSTWVLLAVLVYIGRRSVRPGVVSLGFALWYGTMRVITDFLRVDKTYFGLTGSQLTALTVVLVSTYLLARYRGAPPRFASPPSREVPNSTAQRDAARSETGKRDGSDREA